MFDWASWFRSQLHASAEGFVWALSQIDSRHYLQSPPDSSLGDWSPVRHVWHVIGYERWIALPTMRQWLGDPMPDGRAWPNNDAAWAVISDVSVDRLIAEFRQIRQQQIDLFDEFSHLDWEVLRETMWGPKPLSMVVTKTYQHTLEHTNTLLRMGLWWTDLEGRQTNQ